MRNSFLIVTGYAALVFGASLFGQGLQGPKLGFIFDPVAQGIRPIWGIPGEAALGSPANYGGQVTRAAVSPRGVYALAEVAGTSGVSLVTLSAAAPGALIAGVLPGADRIAFSPSGDSAVLYHEAPGKIQVVTGLPGAPQLSGEITTGKLPGAVSALAVSDGAGAILVAASGGQTGSVLRLSIAGGMTPLLSGQAPSSIAFLRGQDDALIADRLANTVTLIQSVSGTAQVRTVAGSLEGIRQPVAVASSLDNTRAIVANAGSSFTTVTLASGTAQSVACKCQMTDLSRLKGTAVFQAGTSADGSVVVFDGDRSQPRVLFLAGVERPATKVKRIIREK